MKRFAAVIGVAVSSLALASCSPEELYPRIVAACDWSAPIPVIRDVIIGITGQPPGVGVSFAAADKVIAAICAAARQKQAAKGARRLVFVTVQNEATGRITRIPLGGCKASDPRCRVR
jgi:hypothetical protein